MSSSKVSVIIPAFNRVRCIRRAIESVLGQRGVNVEIVVVDDCSTDDTYEVVRSFCRDDQRIQCVRHDTNQGAQAARNSGVYASTGDWITFLDSDDLLLDQSIAVRLRVLQLTSAEVVHSECLVVRPADPAPTYFGVPPLQGNIHRRLLTAPGPVFPSLMISRAAFERICGLDESITSFQEWDTVLQLSRYYEFAFVPEPTFLYDCRWAGTISKDMLRTAIGYEQVVRKHLWRILQLTGPSTVADHFRTAGRFYTEAGEAERSKCCRLIAKGFDCASPKRLLSATRRCLNNVRGS